MLLQWAASAFAFCPQAWGHPRASSPSRLAFPRVPAAPQANDIKITSFKSAEARAAARREAAPVKKSKGSGADKGAAANSPVSACARTDWECQDEEMLETRRREDALISARRRTQQERKLQEAVSRADAAAEVTVAKRQQLEARKEVRSGG